MKTILTTPVPTNGTIRTVTPVDVVAEFLKGRKQTTIDAYRRDLEQLAQFVGCATIDDAAATLLGSGHGPANATVLRYRNHMVDTGLAPATVNRRLSAIKSLVKMSRLMGACAFTIDVQGVRNKRMRDTAGPGLDAVKAILAAINRQPNTPKRQRDRAILRLMSDCGLRRGEVAGISVEDLDLEAGCVWITSKGDTGLTKVTLPRLTRDAIGRWVDVHEGHPALFYALDRVSRGHRLTGCSIWRTVKAMGKLAGIDNLAPHMLRHSAVTIALDQTNGDVRSVRHFSRHADISTVIVYDDNRTNPAGAIADQVAGAIGE